MYRCMMRFPACAGTVAHRQGEDGGFAAILRVFDCDAMSEQWRRDVARGAKDAMSNVAYKLSSNYQQFTTLL